MKHPFATAGKVLLVIAAIPVAAFAALLTGLFGLKEKRTASEVATYLRDFVDGGGGEWNWDDFTSVPIADSRLEDIRKRAAAVDLPPTEEGIIALRGLLAEAERLAPP